MGPPAVTVGSSPRAWRPPCAGFLLGLLSQGETLGTLKGTSWSKHLTCLRPSFAFWTKNIFPQERRRAED